MQGINSRLKVLLDEAQRHKDGPRFIQLLQILVEETEEESADASQSNNEAVPGGETTLRENGKDSPEGEPS